MTLARFDTKWAEMPPLGSPQFEQWLKDQEVQPCFDCLLEAAEPAGEEPPP